MHFTGHRAILPGPPHGDNESARAAPRPHPTVPPRPRTCYGVAIAFHDRIADCNNADLARYLRWRVAGSRVGGFVHRDHMPVLTAVGSPFFGGDADLELPGRDFAARSAALATAAAELARRGHLQLRRERYPVVAAHGDPPLLQLDRGAVPFFGVRPFGVHLCAFVRDGGGLFVWVAVRARDKTFPGMWDNTVAGGQPIGLSLRDNLVKECGEEAAIPPALAARAQAVGSVTYVRADATGLKPDTLFCYDLELPRDFVPRPHDGEVEQFLRLPVREVADAVRDAAICKPNCALVWIDFFLRHGVCDGELDAAARRALARQLRAPLP